MDKGLKKDRFVTISIKASVARKLKSFSKGISKSKSMTLLLMLEFFERNGISSEETLGPKIQTLENLIQKRINAVIAIIRDIEKHQTKSTTAILQALLEQAEPVKKLFDSGKEKI